MVNFGDLKDAISKDLFLSILSQILSILGGNEALIMASKAIPNTQV